MTDEKKSLYDILGVARDATPEVIRKAYRKLSGELHPDRNKDPGATARMAEVNDAYKILSDPDARANYDKFGTAEHPAQKVALNSIMEMIADLIESHHENIVSEAFDRMNTSLRKLSAARDAAKADIRRMENRRKLIRRKKKGEASIFEVIFDSKIEEAQEALAKFDRQEEVLRRMRAILSDYESPESPSSFYQPRTNIEEGLLRAITGWNNR